MHRQSRRWWLVAVACMITLSIVLTGGWSLQGGSLAQEVQADDPGRARPVLELPEPFSYVVKPTRISPDVGGVSGDAAPFFREPHLVVNELGLNTVFMETPEGNPFGRLGWSCSSTDGRDWDCGTISKLGTAEDFHDFADPWVADTRGDPCPTYGAGITLAALENGDRFTAQGVLEEGNRAQTVAYHSQDMGRTWTGPETIPEPAFDAGPDGSKVVFTGRTFVAYRTFIETGQYVSRLGTDVDPCAFSEVLQLTEANDHPRLTGTAEPGGFAMRAVVPGTVAGGSTLTFNAFGPQFETRLRDVPAAVTAPPNIITAFCTSELRCTVGTDVAQTLLYDTANDRYHHVFTDRPVSGEGDMLGDLVTRYNFSDDGGLTWSVPVKVAGSGAEFSEVGASSLEPTLAWDAIREQLLLAYYEKPTRDSDRVELRVRVLAEDGVWSPPVTVDETSYLAGSGENRFGDYFGFQACGGVFHAAHHPVTDDGIGHIAYLAVRYAEPPARSADAGPASRCPPIPARVVPSEPPSVPPTPTPAPAVDAVRRVSGESRLDTAVALSQEAFETADAAVLARADDYPDALAASALAAELDAPVLLTPTGGLDDRVGDELERLGVTDAYLMGGTQALSEQVEQDLDGRGIARTRIGSEERFGTAALIADQVVTLGGPVDHAIVALGARPPGTDAWPDALAAGNLAAAGRAPILLVTPDTTPDLTAAALDRLLPDEATVFIAGGTDAVGRQPQTQLETDGYTTTRLGGAERYATAVAITQEAVRQGADRDPLILVTGTDFADALVAGPAAAQLGGTMLLVAPDDLGDSPATRDYLAEHADQIDTVLLTGGPDTISDQVADQVETLITDP